MESSRSPSVSPKRPASLDLRRLVGSVNQLRFNDNKGELSFFGQKMIILRRDVIRVMRDGLERLVADQAAPFLSYLASGIGIHEGSIFRDSITSTGEEQRAALESLVHSAFEDTNLGLGKVRSEEHTSELQSRLHLVCRLLLEKKKNNKKTCNS